MNQPGPLASVLLNINCCAGWRVYTPYRADPGIRGRLPAMTPAPPSAEPAREILAGLVERVTFHNEENGFCVLRVKVRGHRDLVTLVGHAAIIAAAVTYGLGELDALVPAYAATIHKAQGSKYPAVVIPLLTTHHPMLQRNLLHTGITRGKRLVVAVGSRKPAPDLIRGRWRSRCATPPGGGAGRNCANGWRPRRCRRAGTEMHPLPAIAFE